MKVKELIAALQDQDENTEVFFAYNYGDHCRTEAAEPVRVCTQLEVVEWPYGNCYRTVDRYDEGESEQESATPAVVLK